MAQRRQNILITGASSGLGEGMARELAYTGRRLSAARAKEIGLVTVERLMGAKAEARFAFISDKAEFASEDSLDV